MTPVNLILCFLSSNNEEQVRVQVAGDGLDLPLSGKCSARGKLKIRTDHEFEGAKMAAEHQMVVPTGTGACLS